MTDQTSKLLVVDSSVIHAAGTSEHPTSSKCREALESIKKICHRVVITEKIRGEWGRHFSNYSFNWYSEMTSRGKADLKSGTELNESNQLLDSVEIPNQIRQIIKKDMLLIEAAYSADGIIVTLDDKIQPHFKNYRHLLDLRKDLIWINPVKQDINTVI